MFLSRRTSVSCSGNRPCEDGTHEIELKEERFEATRSSRVLNQLKIFNPTLKCYVGNQPCPSKGQKNIEENNRSTVLRGLRIMFNLLG
jgi:hypothetical protein